MHAGAVEMDSKTTTSTQAHARHQQRRHGSSGSADLSIEELFPDDMGYDADVEVIRPDRYEEMDSESEDESAHRNKLRTVDEELAERMRRLGQEKPVSTRLGELTDHGRKRTSAEFHGEGNMLEVPMSPDLEVQEMVDGLDQPSPAKRRKKKPRRPTAVQQALRKQSEVWSTATDKAEVWSRMRKFRSVSPTTGSEVVGEDDDEQMDMT